MRLPEPRADPYRDRRHITGEPGSERRHLGALVVEGQVHRRCAGTGYASHGWTQAGTALFGFGTAYVAMRLRAGGLADKVGVVPVAVGSLVLEAIGQAVLWQASTPAFAVAGATLTGLGFSLVFPAIGVLATRAVPAGMRGRAVTGPAAGLVIQWSGVPSAFLAGAAATMLALCLLPSLRPGRTA